MCFVIIRSGNGTCTASCIRFGYGIRFGGGIRFPNGIRFGNGIRLANGTCFSGARFAAGFLLRAFYYFYELLHQERIELPA